MYNIEEQKSKHATGLLGIDWETADRIARLTLTDYRDRLQEELDKWNANPQSDTNPTGYWMHPEDVTRNCRTVKLIDELLKDFGGELYA
jgi:hypothetical protein